MGGDTIRDEMTSMLTSFSIFYFTRGLCIIVYNNNILLIYITSNKQHVIFTFYPGEERLSFTSVRTFSPSVIDRFLIHIRSVYISGFGGCQNLRLHFIQFLRFDNPNTNVS